MCGLPKIACAGSLANQGLFGSLRMIKLYNTNLLSIPTQHLASLLACVTDLVYIRNISGCNLDYVLGSLRCKELEINQTLCREETQALVQAMESGVEVVRLNVKPDIKTLTEYTGQGKCKTLLMQKDNVVYSWAMERNWHCSVDTQSMLMLWKYSLNSDPEDFRFRPFRPEKLQIHKDLIDKARNAKHVS